MELDKVLEVIPAEFHRARRFIVTTPQGKTIKRLVAASGKRVFCMAHGSKRYGNYIDPSDWISMVSVEPSPAVEWERSWKRVVKILIQSGFWPEILAQAKDALDIGYFKFRQAIEAERETDKANAELGYDERIKLERAAIAAIDPRLPDLRSMFYPPAKIKSMYFGRSQQEKKKAIADLVDADQAGTVHGRANYDISFEFRPAKDCKEQGPKAWYSEEFKNCGNGHYYLALSKTQALFYEDD